MARFDLAKARAIMKNEKIDCVVASTHDNVYYCSGSDIRVTNIVIRPSVVVIPLDHSPVFFIPNSEESFVRQTTWIGDVRPFGKDPIKSVADELSDKGLDKLTIGIELMYVPSYGLDRLKQLLPSASFANSQPVLDRLRSVKTAEELQLLSEANMMTAKAIAVAFEMARPGDTERDLARDMTTLALKNGADRVGFLELRAGDNAYEKRPCAPTNYRIKVGDMVHVDMGVVFDGYMSDISRMAVVGKSDETQLKAYEIAIQAERSTAEAMLEGATVLAVDNSVRKFYESKGCKYARGSIGHSIGINFHEVPYLGPSHADWVLASGMFFQVEPSLTIGRASVHAEDSFIVTKQGSKIASEYGDISQLQIIR